MARKRDGKIIIKRIVKSGHGGHHGGAWKVAYADFVTAMMAFFLMLWLLSTTDKAKLEGLAQYFTDPSSASRLPPGGEGGILRGTSVLEPSFIEQPPTSPFDMSPTPARGEQTESELADRVVEAFGPVGDTVADNMQTDSTGERVTETSARFEKVEKAIGESLDKHVELAGLKEQVQVTRTKEGLRIELLDKDGVPMFATGSDRLSKEAQALLQVVMAAISAGPDRLSIRGHTDSRPFADGARSDNWRLSADRANATRVALVQLGLSADRIAEVIGKASTEPHLPDRPDDPSNRRISILLMAEPGGSPVSR